MKRSAFALTFALTSGAFSYALAQTQTSQPATTPPPAAAPAAGQPNWYTHQPEENRASKLIGTKVVNTANETIGDVNEIVLSKDGKVAAIVIGVGGFLGLGEREVAVSLESLRMNRDSNGNLVVSVNATKESLSAAPQWRWDTTKK